MRIILIVMFLCFVILSACQNDKNEIKDDAHLQQEVDVKQELTTNHPPDNRVEQEKGQRKASDEHDQAEAELSPQYKVADNWSIVPITDNVNEKVVLLTIDDAPDQYALNMAKTLDELNVGAIFFVNGHLLETEEERKILKEIYDMGFIIGNHTYSHANLADISKEEQLKEIVRVNEVVEDITGERPTFFRAPFGVNTDYSKQVVSDEGMLLMNWSYGYDWEEDYMTKESLTDMMLNTNLLGSGANLLMHDREWTALALHDIVTGLNDKGYEIVDPKLIQTMD